MPRLTQTRLLALIVVTTLLCFGQVCAPPDSGGDPIRPPVVDPQPRVTIETSLGSIVIELFTIQAPQTAAAFLEYVDQGFFTGTLFHEVRSGTSIAAGTYDSDLDLKPTNDPVPNESNNGLTNIRGRVSLVEPSGTDTGTSQFMILLADRPTLDYDPETGKRGQTVFGRVIEGMDVVDAIGALPVSTVTAGDGKRLTNLPTSRLTIIRAFRSGTSDGEGENLPPVVSAGSGHKVAPGTTATLEGIGSFDPNGDTLTYQWTQTAGASVTLNDATAANATFTVPDVAGDLVFQLTVDDGKGETASETVTYTVIQQPMVRLKTTEGDIVLDLLESAPITTQNFLQYVQDGFYNGTIFHRVISGFVVQGGGLLPNLAAQTGLRSEIQNEFDASRSNLRGTLAMAKRDGQPNSATSQFFFNLDDENAFLDTQNGGFTVFARVIEGMNIVNDIAAVETSTQKDPDNLSYDDVPVDPIEIESADLEAGTVPQSFTTTPSGLQYKDLAVGTGDLVTPSSTIRVLYTGRLTNESGDVFDSSTDPEDPEEFALSGLIEGWKEGLGEVPIRVGGRRILIIPPELGYGDEDKEGIPPNSTLWFDIEVLGLED